MIHSLVVALVLSACLVQVPGESSGRASASKNEPGAGTRQEAVQPPAGPAIAFVGLHGGVFEQLKRFEKQLHVRLEYIEDQQITDEQTDFASYEVVFLQHVRGEDRDHYRRLIAAAKQRKPELRIISISGLAEGRLPELTKKGFIEHDPQIREYYGSSPENLRRLLVYTLVTYLGRPGKAEPPVEQDRVDGLYHPDHDGLFPDAEQFLRWASRQGCNVESSPRAVITVHSTHLVFQQPKVVDALIRQFEKHGVLAVATTDSGPAYEQRLLDLKPQVVVHTCHSRDKVAFREKLGVPHLQCIFFRKQSIDQWQQSIEGLSAHEFNFQIVSQEILGQIEPQVGSGTLTGGGSSESFTPIPDRIEHLVARAVSWIRLQQKENRNKRIAIIYWDREMGKAELMRGSATGMFMNGPRSLVKVLKRMKEAGYELEEVPADEDELVEWMMDHGRQIGVWAPGVLDRLARSGQAALVPAELYRKWFEAKVPEQQRREVIARWGQPPGKFLVWEHEGQQFIVIPRIDLGNVVLLPQPLKGEAHDTSRVHDKRIPPPHNYLATYFWLEEQFRADALVHFGTHGTEFLLPGKPIGLSAADWPDILMGTMPNISPWIINNLGESSPVKRRPYAVLINHLVPPSVAAGLSDELLNLHNDIDKLVTLEEGALKEKFRASITQQFLDAHLDRDLHIDLSDGRQLTPEEIMKLAEHLHNIHNETVPVCLHVLGEPPQDDLLVPWLVTCLRSRFLDALAEVVPVPPEEALNPGDRNKYLRKKAEEVVELVIRRGLEPAEALVAVGGEVPQAGLSKKLQDGFDLALRLNEGFARTHQEIDNLLEALNGRFIPPGPSNSPDRNPAVVPTGRNMYLMNPEEVPTRPSWELGKMLVDQLLAGQLESKGHYPKKIAFTLNSFATFQDYGVMESQILYLLGVRPVWDSRNLVIDVEVIPAEELGRPRIDVFISALGYYRDMLPTRMRLLDKAVRLVAQLDEEGNLVCENTRRVQQELVAKGIEPQRAAVLARGRIFGRAPGAYGMSGYYYLIERSGQWDTREQLMEIYLEHSRHVFTEGVWGENAPEAYNAHIQGTEVLVRSWSDRTRSPLSNKYDWYKGGSLSLAIKHLTGKEPQWFFSDVRDPDRARMVVAEDALRTDYRVRLFNRKWIEGMMREGYAGADQIAKHVSNTMGWKIMREGSVSDDIWEEIVDIYLRDSRDLAIREWFEAENPFAFQELTEILLETIRKGYWQPDEATILEIATAYAQSVARHGEGGGLRGGGNTKLEAFVEKILQAPGTKELDTLLAAYQAKAQELSTPEAEAAATEETERTEEVRGRELAPVQPPSQQQAASPQLPSWLLPVSIAAVALFLVLLGYYLRRGIPNR